MKDPRAADFILSRRAAAVVVESPPFDMHQQGASFGRKWMRKIYDMSTKNITSSAVAHFFGVARLAVKLESHPNPRATEEWAEARRSIDCERLVWAAAHIVDAKVHYGDVPKAVMYQRIAALSPAELCDGYATLFAESLSRFLPGFPIPELEVRAAQPAHREFHAVREASILAALARAAVVKGKGKVVVGIVGKGHLVGMQRMSADGSWRAMPPPSSKSKSQRRADRKLLTQTEVNNRAAQRALAEAFLHLASGFHNYASDASAFARHLGPVPDSDFDLYERTLRHFSSMTMLLATLSEAQMASVFGKRAQRIYALLEPFRAALALHAGGPGNWDSLEQAMQAAQTRVKVEVQASMGSIPSGLVQTMRLFERGMADGRKLQELRRLMAMKNNAK